MKLNPQAIINAGSVGGGCSGGIQIGTNVPSGIDNNHRFSNEQERDEYFTTHLSELYRLKTIIVVGSDLQLWTGETNPANHDGSKWNVMSWVIQGMQGTQGEKGRDGVSIRSITANIITDQNYWELMIEMSDDTVQRVNFPIPDVLNGFAHRLGSLETRFGLTGNLLNNLDVAVTQGRYAFNDTSYNKPPMSSSGSVDIYETQGNIIQVAYSIGNGIYTRLRHNGEWEKWIPLSSGENGMNNDQINVLDSLNRRLPAISPTATDLNRYVEQGRYCFNEGTANRPNGTVLHGSVDVHACRDHILQIATSIEGIIFHRALTVETNRWSDWVPISDQTGGATIYKFPRAACVYTTSVSLQDVPTRFYIPWKYIIHDNYGCTPRIEHPDRQNDADFWWIAPKSGSYDIEMLLDLSFIDNPTSIPIMATVTAWFNHADGRESQVAVYEIPFDVRQKNQTTKRIKLHVNNMYADEKIRWGIEFHGASWTQNDNPNVSMTPFRTMLIVDEAEYDTAKRIANLAYKSWSSFYAAQGTAAIVSKTSDDKVRLNGVKWKADIVDIEAKKEQA